MVLAGPKLVEVMKTYLMQFTIFSFLWLPKDLDQNSQKLFHKFGRISSHSNSNFFSIYKKFVKFIIYSTFEWGMEKIGFLFISLFLTEIIVQNLCDFIWRLMLLSAKFLKQMAYWRFLSIRQLRVFLMYNLLYNNLAI